jgi:type II pantothenate kinase
MNSFMDNASLGDERQPSAATRDILLPSPTSNKISHIALDIGGTLCKLVYYTKDKDGVRGGGRLNFTHCKFFVLFMFCT